MRSALLLIYLVSTVISFGQTYEIEEIKLVANIQTINGINAKSDDFSPVVLNNKIYFTSSRQYNKHVVGENNWDKNGYLNIFYGTYRNDEGGTIDVKDVKLLSNKLNSGNHTGPMSFTKSGDTLFFTQVIQVSTGAERIFKPQLFMAVKKKEKWTKIKQLPFSTNESGYGHPSFDASKNRLYFASDRPGGKGGNDIYYSTIVNGAWTAPVNLEEVNTNNEEKFPFVVNGNIFFSSDRSGGQGLLDIYYSSSEPSNYPIKLEGLNSPYDDFGVSILPDLSAGYFSSNRTGNDDILYFTLEKKITMKNQLAGSFTFRTLAGTASNLAVQLYNENGEFVYEQRTDDKGHFLFDDIVVDSNFSVRLDGVARDEMTLEFFDEHGIPSASFLLSEEGTFKYKKLYYEKGGITSFIPEDMIDLEDNTANLSGKLVLENNPTDALVNATVNLLGLDKNVAFTTTTDENGNFEFKNINIESEYYLQVPTCSQELILYIYNSQDAIFTQLKCNSKDEFMYRRLRPETGNTLSLIEETNENDFMLNSSEIIGKFDYIDADGAFANTQVHIYDENGILLESTYTDSSGNFRFNNLSSENTYKFSVDSNDPIQLTLYNRYAREVAKIQQEENKFFIFRPLGFQTEGDLSLEDKSQFDLTIIEQYEAVTVYFNTNQAKVKKEDLDKLNTLYKLLKKYPQIKLSVNAYADATASDEYNFVLSQKRGDWIVAYLMGKGIDKNRFTVNAYGETKLIDPEDDAVNRRAELRIYQ